MQKFCLTFSTPKWLKFRMVGKKSSFEKRFHLNCVKIDQVLICLIKSQLSM